LKTNKTFTKGSMKKIKKKSKEIGKIIYEKLGLNDEIENK
jgi:hypothetical protein